LECFLIFSCQTERESVPALADPSLVQAAVEESPAAIRTVPEAGPFDPQNASRELFDSTLAEVQLFITFLNDIIHSQKYDDWMKNLSREYIDTYSSPDYLRKASEDPLFKSRKTVLTSPKDFFMYNVVPSRVNIDKVEVDEPVPKLIDCALTRTILEQALAVFRPTAYKTAVFKGCFPKN
jgi:hypothetical protein